MIDPSRHVPLRPMPWSALEAAAAIEEIVADAIAYFDAERFWPAHPREDGAPDGLANLWIGAAGMIWGLDYLARTGATGTRLDFVPWCRGCSRPAPPSSPPGRIRRTSPSLREKLRAADP